MSWSGNPNFLFTSTLPFAIAHVCICRTKKSMNTCKISKSLSKFLWNFSFTKEEVCFPVNICLPIVTCSTFVFLERTRSRHWRTFTIVWSIRNYFFYFTLLFLLQNLSFKDYGDWIKRRLINFWSVHIFFDSIFDRKLVSSGPIYIVSVTDICHLAKLLSFYQAI